MKLLAKAIVASGILVCIPHLNLFAHPFFDGQTPMDITLIVDYDHISNEVRKAKEGKDDEGKPFYFDSITSSPATLKYLNSQQQVVSEVLKVQPRGASRLVNCPVPMLKLNFDRDSVLPESPFYGLNKVKLVIPCPFFELEQNARNPDRWVNFEKVMYELYEILSEKHYKTRAVKISLQDVSGNAVIGRFPYKGTFKNTKSFTYTEVFGFIIEPNSSIENRMPGLEEFDNGEDGWSFTKTDESGWNTLALFNFMIGNGDLDLLDEVRNVQLFVKSSEVKKIKKENEEGKIKNVIDPESVRVAYPFLYDLDYSDAVQGRGFVAEKEKGSFGSPLYTQFHCNKNVAGLRSTASKFIERRAQLEQKIESTPFLSDAERTYLKTQVLAPFLSFIRSDDNLQMMVKKYSAKCK